MITLENQYNLVVNQNRNLQTQTRIQNKIIQLMLLDIQNDKILIDYHKQAVKELAV